jgi:hypothetical protein
MATATVRRAYHGALTASAVDTITLSRAFEFVEIVNRSGTAEIFYTLDGSTPTVGGAECYIVPGAIVGSVRANPQGDQNTVVVNLISSGTPNYSVIGADNMVVPTGI